MTKLSARLKRWWHCLLGTFGRHCQVDVYIDEELAVIACECGKVFWVADGWEIST